MDFTDAFVVTNFGMNFAPIQTEIYINLALKSHEVSDMEQGNCSVAGRNAPKMAQCQVVFFCLFLQ